MREHVRTLQSAIEAARAGGQALVLPGAYDALSARLVQAAGFEAVYVTGAGLSNSSLGVPDIGLVTATELRDHVARLADVVDIPLVVDADTGFGNAINMARTVRHLERAGASALQIEDQLFPKKCGHFAGKAVVPVQEMVQKVRAAVDARSSEDLLIIARTDARAVSTLDEAIDRALLYQEAGADALFVEAPVSVEELQAIGDRLTGPLVANMVEGGRTPLLTAAELGALGYSMVLFANVALRVAQRAVTEALAELRATGSTNALLDRMATWSERQGAVGKPEFDALEQKYSVEG
jgi:2-methylisocitrate lyase-like PEP mutase family enzyme